MKKPAFRFTLAPALALVLGVMTVTAFLFPHLRERRLRTNEGAAAAGLRALASAKADFRANDRDGNGLQDFWTGDLARLHAYGLIPRELAEADARALTPLVPRPAPHDGYLFSALDRDEFGEPYRQRTDGDFAAPPHRNSSKFAFCAYPALYGRTGRHTLFIDEGNTVFKMDLQGRPLRVSPGYPAALMSTYSHGLD